MATLSALRTETRNLLDDNQHSSSQQRWSNTDLNKYLNDAQVEFSSLTRCFIRKVTISLTMDTAEYSIADGTIRGIVGMPDTVYYTYTNVSTITRVLYPTTEKILDSTVGPNWRAEKFVPDQFQHPVQFYLAPSLSATAPNVMVIGIYRMPSATAGSIVIAAPAIPVENTTDGNEMSIPLQYHEALPYGAAYRAFLRNQDAQSLSLAAAYKARYMEFVETAQRATGRT